MKSIYRFSVLLLALSSTAFAAESALKSDQEKISYVMGFQIGHQLKQQGLNDIDINTFSRAIQDALSNNPPQLDMQEAQAVMQKFQQQKAEEQQKLADKNAEAGKAFLATNKDKPGVVTTESGLQYKVVKAGSGKKPAATDNVTVHYTGTLIDGTEFDSSHKRGQPATFQLDRVIPGWTEVLQLMEEGAKWQVFIPSELAYGPRGPSPVIGPNSTLLFDIELIKVN